VVVPEALTLVPDAIETDLEEVPHEEVRRMLAVEAIEHLYPEPELVLSDESEGVEAHVARAADNQESPDDVVSEHAQYVEMIEFLSLEQNDVITPTNDIVNETIEVLVQEAKQTELTELELEEQSTAPFEAELRVHAAEDRELPISPVELFDSFTETLVALSELSVAAEQGLQGALEHTTQQEQALPSDMLSEPILQRVAERLIAIDPEEKEAVALTMQQVFSSVQRVRLLVAEGADLSEIVSETAKLEAFCMALFEATGIEYSKEDLKQFIELLLRPEEFLLKQQTIPQADLEHSGTHEAIIAHTVSIGLSTNEGRLRQFLGNFALLLLRFSVPLTHSSR
jgi:hypothetical protein